MKKITLILLSLSALVLLSACGKVKYEFIDGFYMPMEKKLLEHLNLY